MKPPEIARRILACRKCARLRAHCARVAREKRRAYRNETYWGRPVPSFGSASPRLLVVGLAPGAHGANRTGRVFTGDSSGEWLYRALFEVGLANRPESLCPGDGMRLKQTAISCALRCAPPGNRPTAREREACRPFLVAELETYRELRVVVPLGRIAWDATRKAWQEAGRTPWAERPSFGHGREMHTVDGCVHMICSYHPSRQNTQTRRLTRAMFRAVFERAREILAKEG